MKALNRQHGLQTTARDRIFSSVVFSPLVAGIFFGTFFCLPLSGCARAPEPAAYPHSAAEGALLPADLFLTMNDGGRLPIRLYRPAPPERFDKPRAVVLAFHGFGDSRDAWETLAPALTKAGLLIVAPDIRGFGEAPARHGWSGTDRLLEDAQAERAWIAGKWPGTPIYAMGESMGGALAYLLATAPASAPPSPSALQGVILLAPAVLNLGQPASGALDLWDFLTPGQTLTAADAPGHRVATTNYRAMRRLFFDPLTSRSATVHALHGLVALMRRAAETARSQKRSQTRLLFIWGDCDQFVSPKATARFLRALPADGSARLDEIDGGYHLLSREKRRVGDDILTWMFKPDAFLPSGGDINAATWLSLH